VSTYWDTSALINALVSVPVAARLTTGQHVTRPHAFVEVFHHISGRGLPRKNGTRLQLSPGDAALLIRGLAKRMERLVNLDEEQTLKALDDAQGAGVMGRKVHDWLHVRSARIDGAQKLLTRDPGLSALAVAQGLTVEQP
jgi:hypothetical protein